MASWESTWRGSQSIIIWGLGPSIGTGTSHDIVLIFVFPEGESQDSTTIQRFL
jgi:hypothetical protein